MTDSYLIPLKMKQFIGGVINANGHSYVDLGLPSGTLWATMNVGATSESDYGDYFMWGSTIPNNDTPCDWEHAPFNNGSSEYDDEYFNSVKNTVCPNDILAKEYDAASHIMGGDWRLPTKAEIQELLDNTTNEGFTNYKGTGVFGCKFTSKTDASKYVFIPAAGRRNGGSVNYVGGIIYVWSSSLYTSNPYYAWNLMVDLYGWNINYYLGDRYYGYAVRGVL